MDLIFEKFNAQAGYAAEIIEKSRSSFSSPALALIGHVGHGSDSNEASRFPLSRKPSHYHRCKSNRISLDRKFSTAVQEIVDSGRCAKRELRSCRLSLVRPASFFNSLCSGPLRAIVRQHHVGLVLLSQAALPCTCQQQSKLFLIFERQ